MEVLTTKCSGVCITKYKTSSIQGANTKNLPKCRRCFIRIDYTGSHCPCCGTPLSRRTVYKTKINLVK